MAGYGAAMLGEAGQSKARDVSVSYPDHEEELQQIAALRRDVDRLLILTDGDDSLGIAGLRQRLDDMEDLAEEIKGFKSTLRGISIGLGITGVSSVGALAAIIAKLF